jgi:hypothetical protein
VELAPTPDGASEAPNVAPAAPSQSTFICAEPEHSGVTPECPPEYWSSALTRVSSQPDTDGLRCWLVLRFFKIPSQSRPVISPEVPLDMDSSEDCKLKLWALHSQGRSGDALEACAVQLSSR